MHNPIDDSHVPAIVRVNDVCLILGVSPTTAYQRLRMVKRILGKSKGQVVSFSEFCKVVGVTFHDAARALRRK